MCASIASTLPLRDEKDRPFPLRKKLKTLRKAGETAEWRVWVPSGEQRIAGRLCGIRKSEEAIERANRRLVRKQQLGKKLRHAGKPGVCLLCPGIHHLAEESSFQQAGAGVLSAALADRVESSSVSNRSFNWAIFRNTMTKAAGRGCMENCLWRC